MERSAVKSLVPLFVIVMLSGATFAQTGDRAVSPGTTTAQTPSLPQASPAGGVIKGSIYENEYFGLRFAIPTGWSIHGDATKKDFMERGKDQIVAKDDQEKARLDASIQRTSILLTTSKLPLGATGDFNALFMALAEPVSLSTTGEVYVKQLKSVLQKAKTPFTISDERVETINGVEFRTLTTMSSPSENLVRQKFYILIKKGYALSLVSTIVSDKDSEIMNSIMKSVSVQ